MTESNSNVETKKFSAEIGKVLNLMIHSLYTNKDIFLRELISNASDACDKLRYLGQSDSNLTSDQELNISIELNKDNKTITIIDNGIGMTKSELEENLGTIAKSGTQEFLSQLTGDKKRDSLLIGQFGVGFYSAYMVANTVEVLSRKALEAEAYKWISKGDGEYQIMRSSDAIDRGTKIILHVKESAEEYLDHFRIKHIIKSYSDHISWPIYYLEESKEKVQVNSASALWTRAKSDITTQQYEEFYRSVSFSADKAWLTIHNKNEGAIEFTNLLFVPSSKTFDLFHPDRKRRVKLYIKRVFITDENIDIIPHYLRFLRGVIDSEDLPLNISRETLQYNSTIEKIKNAVTKKVIGEFKKNLEQHREDYEKFWHNFGAAFKEGLCESIPNAEKLLEVCLFYSCLHNKLITLDEYIASMQADQTNIYCLSGDSIDKLKSSPQIEGFISKQIDVLLFTDSVDDFWVSTNHSYKEKEIKSVTRSDIDLKSTKNETEDTPVNYQELTEYFKTTLDGLVKDVVVSKKLSTSPACLVVEASGLDIRMERFLVEQKQLAKSSAKILEINPKHNIVLKILENLYNESHKSLNNDLIHLLFDQACITEGEEVKDPAGFAKRLNDIIDKIL
jgi:molecular chaperone HtpG